MPIYRAIIWSETRRAITRAESIRLFGARVNPFEKITGTFRGRDIRILAASSPERLAGRVEKYANELDTAESKDLPTNVTSE